MTSHKIITVLCKFLSDTIRGTSKLESFCIKEPKNIVPKSTEADAWNVHRELDSCLLLSCKALNSGFFFLDFPNSWDFSEFHICLGCTPAWSIKNPITRQVQLAFMLEYQAVSAWLWLEYPELFVLPLCLTCWSRGIDFSDASRFTFCSTSEEIVSALYLFLYLYEDPDRIFFHTAETIC